MSTCCAALPIPGCLLQGTQPSTMSDKKVSHIASKQPMLLASLGALLENPKFGHRILYQASSDGWDYNTLIMMARGRTPSLLIAAYDSYVFGFYTSTDWTLLNERGAVQDNQAWAFSVDRGTTKKVSICNLSTPQPNKQVRTLLICLHLVLDTHGLFISHRARDASLNRHHTDLPDDLPHAGDLDRGLGPSIQGSCR